MTVLSHTYLSRGTTGQIVPLIEAWGGGGGGGGGGVML